MEDSEIATLFALADEAREAMQVGAELVQLCANERNGDDGKTHACDVLHWSRKNVSLTPGTASFTDRHGRGGDLDHAVTFFENTSRRFSTAAVSSVARRTATIMTRDRLCGTPQCSADRIGLRQLTPADFHRCCTLGHTPSERNTYGTCSWITYGILSCTAIHEAVS